MESPGQGLSFSFCGGSRVLWQSVGHIAGRVLVDFQGHTASQGFVEGSELGVGRGDHGATWIAGGWRLSREAIAMEILEVLQ